MAEKVGYDQETGLHLEAAPPTPRKELHVLQDGTYNQVNGLLSMMHHGYRIKNISQKGVGHRKSGPPPIQIYTVIRMNNSFICVNVI